MWGLQDPGRQLRSVLVIAGRLALSLGAHIGHESHCVASLTSQGLTSVSPLSPKTVLHPVSPQHPHSLRGSWLKGTELQGLELGAAVLWEPGPSTVAHHKQ